MSNESYEVHDIIYVNNKNTELILMHIHERFKSIREDKDYTQAELAEFLGTTRQQVYKYESGAQEMTTERLKKFCLCFGVSADYVLGLPKHLHWPR